MSLSLGRGLPHVGDHDPFETTLEIPAQAPEPMAPTIQVEITERLPLTPADKLGRSTSSSWTIHPTRGGAAD